MQVAAAGVHGAEEVLPADPAALGFHERAELEFAALAGPAQKEAVGDGEQRAEEDDGDEKNAEHRSEERVAALLLLLARG